MKALRSMDALQVTVVVDNALDLISTVPDSITSELEGRNDARHRGVEAAASGRPCWGSLLRPTAVLAARARREAGQISPGELRSVEDAQIRNAVRMEKLRLSRRDRRGVSPNDVPHRFPQRLLRRRGPRGSRVEVSHRTKTVEFSPPRLEVEGKLERTRGIAIDDVAFLKFVTRNTPKVCIPSAPMHNYELRMRIDETSRYVPREQLALSPQCGFSSTVEGNEVTVDDQITKLRLVQEAAADVWGGF